MQQMLNLMSMENCLDGRKCSVSNLQHMHINNFSIQQGQFLPYMAVKIKL